MAFLRRGKVLTPHKKNDGILVRRVDGTPIRIAIDDLNRWEEFQFTNGMKITVIYWGLASSTAVENTFDEVSYLVDGKAVQP